MERTWSKRCIRANSGHNKRLLSQLKGFPFSQFAEEPAGRGLWHVICVFVFCFLSFLLCRTTSWGLTESVKFQAVSLFLYLPQYLVKGFLLTLCNQNKCALNVIWFQSCWDGNGDASGTGGGGWWVAGGLGGVGGGAANWSSKLLALGRIISFNTMCNISKKCSVHDGFE